MDDEDYQGKDGQETFDIRLVYRGTKIAMGRVLPKFNIPKKINLPKIDFPFYAKLVRDLLSRLEYKSRDSYSGHIQFPPNPFNPAWS